MGEVPSFHHHQYPQTSLTLNLVVIIPESQGLISELRSTEDMAHREVLGTSPGIF